MKTDFKALLESLDGELFPDSLKKEITEAFHAKVDEKVEEQVELAVESAVKKQDKRQAKKLKKALEAIDVDHTEKAKEMLEAQEAKHTEGLLRVKEHYEQQLEEGAREKMDYLVDKLDGFFESTLHTEIEKIDEKLTEAATNTKARKVLEGIRNSVVITDDCVTKEVEEAILDGASQIDNLKKENAKLKRDTRRSRTHAFLAEKTANLPRDLAEHLWDVFRDKPIRSIKENWKFVIDRHRKDGRREERREASRVRENAQSRKVDRKLLAESADGDGARTPKKPVDSAVAQYADLFNQGRQEAYG